MAVLLQLTLCVAIVGKTPDIDTINAATPTNKSTTLFVMKDSQAWLKPLKSVLYYAASSMRCAQNKQCETAEPLQPDPIAAPDLRTLYGQIRIGYHMAPTW